MLSVQPPQTYSMWTRDGVRLDADVYFPDSAANTSSLLRSQAPDSNDLAKTFPVLLMRQPYGRAIASTIVYAHPRWYSAQGYIVVIQDVRGRGTSEGKFELFRHEVTDGEDTVKWAAQLPGSDGQVGMYGFSYQGMTQLHAAQSRPSALKTIVPAMTGYHLYEDWATENGAFCFQLGLVWGLQLAAETARLQGDAINYQKLLKASRSLPLYDPIPAQPEVLAGVASFFHDWVAVAADDPYWQALTPQLDEVDLPMLHIGGWFDPYLRGDIRLYREMARRSQYAQPLWIGPWAHIPWNRKVGEVDFGEAAISPVDRLQIQWFDAILKGHEREDNELTNSSAAVSLFEMGRNQWRKLTDWPDEHACNGVNFGLASEGLSHIREDSGMLSQVVTQPLITDTIVHDPWNPAPALGGHSAIPAGSFERSAVDARGDVLTYTSAPLTAELRVVGVPEVWGAITASTPSYDICAVLSRIDDQGKVFNLTQGYRSFGHGISSRQPDALLPVPLHPTCFSLAPGERLRLSISAACFPAYLVNPGTNKLLPERRLIDAQIITIDLRVGVGSGSVLKLPVVT